LGLYVPKAKNNNNIVRDTEQIQETVALVLGEVVCTLDRHCYHQRQHSMAR